MGAVFLTPLENLCGRSHMFNKFMYLSDFTYNGHLYLVVNDYLTQNDSQANCVSLGANLVSVWSHEENSRLLEVTTEDYCRPNR